MVASRYDTENNFECSEDMLFFLDDETDRYYQCNHGEIVLKTCPSGQEINQETKTCTPYSKDDPQLRFVRSAVDAESRHNETIIQKGQCNHGETRKKEGFCKQYYECKDGTEVIARCMDCQNYDENEKKCRYVFDSPCKPQFPEPPTTSDDSTPAAIWTSTPTHSDHDVTEVTEMSSRMKEDGWSSSVPTGGEYEVTTPPTTSTSDDFTPVDPAIWSSNPTTSDQDVTEVIETSTGITADGGSSLVPTGGEKDLTTPSGPSEPESSALPFGDCKHRRALPDCKYYLECHEGELVTRRCGWLQYFDSLTSTCSFMGYKCYGTE